MTLKKFNRERGVKSPLFSMTLFVGLDIAEKMGVVYNRLNSGIYYCTTYKGAPVEQFEMLRDVLGDELESVVVFMKN